MSTALQLLGQMDPSKMADEPWRVVTSMLIHVDAEHLLSNLVAGAGCAAPLAARAGVGNTCLVALLGGASANAATALVAPEMGPWVGASTAVFALLGAACSVYRSMALVVLAAIVCFAAHGPDVNTHAHAIGAIAGAVIGLLIDSKAKRSTAAQIAIVGCCAAAVSSCLSYAQI